jgi:predicted naringenin-chalcone synthase
LEPKIVSINYALPENSYTQRELFYILGYPSRFLKIFEESGIDKRHLWINPLKLKDLSWQEATEEYIEGAFQLSLQAILNCLDGRSVGDVGCLVFSSCTGFCPGPTIPHLLAKELGLPSNIYLTNIISHGCEGGFPGLKRAYDYSKSSGKPALVIACELCSTTYFPEPEAPEPENHYELLRSNAIFADAASCAIVGFDEDPRHPRIIDTESCFNPEYINDLGYTWRDGRLRVLLSKGVPELAPLVVKPAVDAVLQRQGMDISGIEWFVVHAAGSAVLDNLRDALGLPEEKLFLSRKTLREVGNCSSATIGITGTMLMSQDISEGDYVMVLSVGPGMVGGCTLLQFGS